MPSTTLNSDEQQLSQFYLNLPFNQFLGLTLVDIGDKHLSLQMPMKDIFIGNTAKAILHGGIISSAIDASGGMLALRTGINKLQNLSTAEKIAALTQSSTIGLRVDYLQPGQGTCFTITAELLRSGKRISVTRMEMYNEKKDLIAAGAASYVIGNG